jgi:hypothetical protein
MGAGNVGQRHDKRSIRIHVLTEAQQRAASLDVLDDEETENLWVHEAEERYAAHAQGHVSTRPAADAIRDTRARIR